eukprot:EG_transcript_17891
MAESKALPLLPTGEFENKYILQDLIGSGTYAEVWRCTKRGTQRDFAAKRIVKAGPESRKSSAKSFHTEVEVMRRLGALHHPHLIQLEELVDDGAALYLVMELAQGGSLWQVLSIPLLYPEPLAAELLANVLEALAYLHHNGVVHCDVKPENLLMKYPLPTNRDQLQRSSHLLTAVKLADFGLAAIVGETDTLQRCCGTPYYIAPEVLRCGYYRTGPPYGRACDVWSLGVTGYVMLTGCPPFQAHKQAALFSAIVKGDWAFPPAAQLSEAARDFLRHLLVPCDLRPTASQALRHPWLAQHRAARPPALPDVLPVPGPGPHGTPADPALPSPGPSCHPPPICIVTSGPASWTRPAA